jgi:hypothetical protein
MLRNDFRAGGKRASSKAIHLGRQHEWGEAGKGKGGAEKEKRGHGDRGRGDGEEAGKKRSTFNEDRNATEMGTI